MFHNLQLAIDAAVDQHIVGAQRGQTLRPNNPSLGARWVVGPAKDTTMPKVNDQSPDSNPIIQVLDSNRYREIQRDALLGGNLWLTLALAAERGDNAAARAACEQIRALTRATFALVNQLGTGQVDA